MSDCNPKRIAMKRAIVGCLVDIAFLATCTVVGLIGGFAMSLAKEPGLESYLMAPFFAVVGFVYAVIHIILERSKAP